MKIALIAPPFIAVPPPEYGGTELFVAHLGEGLKQAGLEVVTYTNGESTVDTERRSIYENSQWPIKSPEQSWIRETNHYSWAVQMRPTATSFTSVNQAPFSRFVDRPCSNSTRLLSRI